MGEYTKSALAKIASESKKGKYDKYASAMSARCVEVLNDFCTQNDEFAQAVAQSSITFDEAMRAVVKQIHGQSISDIDAFKALVGAYFPGAGIRFTMSVDLCASVGGEDNRPPITQTVTPEPEPMAAEPAEADKPVDVKPHRASLDFSLDDLF